MCAQVGYKNKFLDYILLKIVPKQFQLMNQQILNITILVYTLIQWNLINPVCLL